MLCEQVDVTSDERDTRHHYLKGLEGCSTGLLARVQAAFEDLYGLLRAMLDHSLRKGQVIATQPLRSRRDVHEGQCVADTNLEFIQTAVLSLDLFEKD